MRGFGFAFALVAVTAACGEKQAATLAASPPAQAMVQAAPASPGAPAIAPQPPVRTSGLGAVAQNGFMPQGSAIGTPASGGSGVVINGVDLSPQTVAQLQQSTGAVAPGRYWYDKMSGLWGFEGQGTAGQILAGMPIGGPLAPSASIASNAPHTNVFFNGRELALNEVQFLVQVFGQAPPGRYWLNAQLVGGLEGGPPAFNLAQAIQTAQARQGGGSGCSYGSSYTPDPIGGPTGTSVGCDENGNVMVSTPNGSYYSGQ